MNTQIKLGIVEDQREFAIYIENTMKSNSSIDKIYHWGSAEKFWRDEKGKNLDLLLQKSFFSIYVCSQFPLRNIF